MSADTTGRIILQPIEKEAVRKQVARFLSRSLSSVSSYRIDDLMTKLPGVVTENVCAKEAQRIIDKIKTMGADAQFHPDPNACSTDENPVGSPDNEAFASSISRVSASSDAAAVSSRKLFTNGKQLLERIAEINKEIWLILSMLVIVVGLNYLITAKYVLLSLYTLPTLFSAYFFGRRHATLTAFFCLLLVIIAVRYNPALLSSVPKSSPWIQWYDIGAWGAILMVTGYAMGTLYERNETRIQEIRKTYQGLIVILRHFMSNDKYTENHCYRVSIYAANIASCMGFDAERIEDIRSAALLHDLGKLDLSRELLHKAAALDSKENALLKSHVDKGVAMLGQVKAPLNRIIPIILAHHEKVDGTGYYQKMLQEIPLESMVLKVADVYDALVSDRPYRKAIPPLEAKEIIAKGAGKEFHPKVVAAFLKAYNKNQLEVPHVVV